MLELDAFWDWQFRSWVLIVLDEQGNQIWDALYYPTKDQLEHAINNF